MYCSRNIGLMLLIYCSLLGNDLSTKGKASFVLSIAYDKNMEYQKAIEVIQL